MYCVRITSVFVLVSLFDLMLQVRGKEHKSCRDVQLLNHTVPVRQARSLPEEVYQYLVPFHSPVTDNLLFLNQQSEKFFAWNE